MSAHITLDKEMLLPFSVKPLPVSFGEPDHSPFWLLLRKMGYTDFELAVMKNFISMMPLIILAAKNKGVRFKVSDIEDDKIISLDGDVMVFRGRAGELLYDLFKGA